MGELAAMEERNDVPILSRGHILDDLKAAFSKSQDTSIIPLKNLHDDILVTLYKTLGGEDIVNSPNSFPSSAL